MSKQSSTKQAKTYHISCHCQAHVLRLDIPNDTDTPSPFDQGGVCDCSHCLKNRIVWGFAPPGTVSIVRGLGKDGAANLQEYRFGSKSYGHSFCGVCGTHVLGNAFDGDNKVTSFNFRAIRDTDFDLWKLPLVLYSGLDREPAYKAITLSDIPNAEAYLSKLQKDETKPTKIYVGSCHCQAIMFAVRCQPLEEVHLCDCACSICLGNGVIWLYPGRENVAYHPAAFPDTLFTPADGILTEYRFGKKINGHFFCKTCGSHVFERSEQSFGLNIALLNEASGYLEDVLGLKADRKSEDNRKVYTKLGGLDRNDEDKYIEPHYALRL
ncbi:hypothetical protein CI109_104452 [Kwoniella shandongensis]|uniref:Uncharacterized protein n=1 Tax=Kwoniella shandongensis TaxID=1734106 RepID=A0A5M6BN80_9TREE|nr:uncharacterized protein CI109_007302 [Kwoniella shandongensis]KAA5524354.1 hypothetical protein CI109_007302 [Kwoniella shandongensis]